jgi:putative tryptophan/tyrosine transport system substrate-binding protein
MVHATRRQVITLLGGASVFLPLAGRAQQSAMPVVGFLHTGSLELNAKLLEGFRKGLAQGGFVEGRNVDIEFRWAEGREERLPELAADLVRQHVSIIATPASTPAALAAKAATTDIPIVFASGGDPVELGLVASLNRPGGNVTGVVFFNSVLAAKRLELLHQIVPRAMTVAMLVNRNFPFAETERKDVQAAAQALGQQLIVTDVDTVRGIETAFESFLKRGAGALFVGSGAFFNSNREYVVALAARFSLPASYSWREAAVAGGLMSYGASQTDAYRQVGIYAGRILKGEKPGDLPVMQSTTFEFVLNLKTAKALGLTVSDKVLALANEVIE